MIIFSVSSIRTKFHLLFLVVGPSLLGTPITKIFNMFEPPKYFNSLALVINSFQHTYSNENNNKRKPNAAAWTHLSEHHHDDLRIVGMSAYYLARLVEGEYAQQETKLDEVRRLLHLDNSSLLLKVADDTKATTAAVQDVAENMQTISTDIKGIAEQMTAFTKM